MSGMQAMRDRVLRVNGRNPTPRDFLEVTRRGRPGQAIVGGPKEVADRLEQWFVERRLRRVTWWAATHMPGTFEDFVRLVVPELQRRGLFQKDYTGRDAAGESGAAAAGAGVVETGSKAGLSSDVATTRKVSPRRRGGGEIGAERLARRVAGPAGRRCRA